MKTPIIFIVILMFCFGANAQYALQIGKQRIPIRNGDVFSRQQLLSGNVRLLFLPDSLSPNGGVNGIGFITTDKKGNAKAYNVTGNVLFPPVLAGVVEDTLTSAVMIQQIRTKNNHIRPVKIRLTLAE